MKKQSCFIMSLLLSSPLVSAQVAISHLPQEALYQNWLISRCLGKFTDSENTRQDALRSASAYLEFSTLPLIAFEKGEKLIERYLKEKSTGSVPGSYHTLACLRLSHSKEANDIFTAYEKSAPNQ
ncbi:Uncharacterised protein [Serratia ficaria]|uniref:T6SS amidase immunity protein Tai4 family protein n=1 Tax=Serratia ficaria TaxID=61651 RepID=UPI0021839200|nr:T6SS amidase immunity protein Tai4 family protein [Serratia ficaria]CAI2422359.1 Uncharacterised protein [Serratia ficaria]